MKYGIYLAGPVFFLTLFLSFSAESRDPIPEIPVEGMVTMVDIGAKKCIPCKMMAPILEKLEKEYEDRAAIIFVDVWQPENKVYAKRFNIRAIPTQIFFDSEGNEVFRHVGFFAEKSIREKLRELGVN